MFMIKAHAGNASGRARNVNTPGGERALRQNLQRNTNMNNRQIGQALRRARNLNANIMSNRRG